MLPPRQHLCVAVLLWFASVPGLLAQTDSRASEARKKLEGKLEEFGKKLGEALANRLLDPACKGDDFSATDPSGNVFVVCSVSESNDERAYLLRKHRNTDGKKLWERKFSESESANWRPRGLVVTEDACFVAAARNGDNGKDDWVVARLKSEDGEQVWEYAFDGPGNGYDYPSAIVQSHDKNLVLAGLSSESEERSSFLVAKISSETGAVLWVHRTPNGDCCRPSVEAMVANSDGDVIITGSVGTTKPRNGTDMITMVVSGDGKQRWHKVYDNEEKPCDSGRLIAQAPDGGIVVLGTSCNELSGQWSPSRNIRRQAKSRGIVLFPRRSFRRPMRLR